MNLKPYQQSAVGKLVDSSLTLLKLPGERQKLVLKAPTGSGKTVMMGAWLQQMARTVPMTPDLPIQRFAYLWIAPNKLHQQSLTKLRSFFEETRTLRCVEFHDLGDRALAENDILFFNWQSISQAGNVVIRSNEGGRYLEAILEVTRRNGIEIIVILDEAHFFATRGEKAQKLLDSVRAKIEVDVSATPVFQGAETVVVHRSHVVDAQMIKTRVSLNPAVHDEGTGENLNEYLLRQSLGKLQALRESYATEGSPVRPLLLIQLPNEGEKTTDDDRRLKDALVRLLDQQYDISGANHKLAVWLSEEKLNLEGLEANDGLVQVLLFKQAIALGWDCPRAAVLLIYRELKSESFTVQTVGRILRMPEQCHYRNPELNQGYVFTNLSAEIIKIEADSMDYLVTQKAVRRAEWASLQLPSTYFNQRAIRNRLGIDFRKVLNSRLEKNLDLIVPELLRGATSEQNRQKLAARLWQIEPKTIEVRVIRDTSFHAADDDNEEETVLVERSTFARTPTELSTELRKFCWSQVGAYAKVDSAPVLEMALLEACERYLEYPEFDAIKILLHPDNRTDIQKAIEDALEDYRIKKEQEASLVTKTPVTEPWDVPQERLYPEVRYVAVPAPSHALQLFFQELTASQPERLFAQFLEERVEAIDWWYKNGDSGKEHFAVPYVDSYGTPRLFFVDFIIQLRHGPLALFDTKTKGSDTEAANKHNALLKVMDDWNRSDSSRHFIGGVVLFHDGAWRYSSTPVTGLLSVAPGWEFFDPKQKAGIA